jgi:hypothetical protein
MDRQLWRHFWWDISSQRWFSLTFVSAGKLDFEAPNISSMSTTKFMKVFQFPSSLPSDAILDGIEVIWSKKTDSQGSVGAMDFVVQMMYKDECIGKNLAKNTSQWNPQWTNSSYGGPYDLWGFSSWTPAIINDRKNFGTCIAAQNVNPAQAGDASVSFVAMTLYFHSGKSFQMPFNSTPDT